jgi:hypothetical protein
VSESRHVRAAYYANGKHYMVTNDGARWVAPDGAATYGLDAALPTAGKATLDALDMVPVNDTRLADELARSDARRAQKAAETAAVPESEPRCPKCDGAMWNNIATKRNPKAPDFKCKDRSCDGVVWPPRENGQVRQQPAQAASAAKPAPAAPPPGDDDFPGDESDELPF